MPLKIFENLNLETLLLRNNNFEVLPEDIGNLINLKTLYLNGTKIKYLPDSIGNLKKLELLNVQFCDDLKHLPETIGNLERLKVLKFFIFDIGVPESVFKLLDLEVIEVLL